MFSQKKINSISRESIQKSKVQRRANPQGGKYTFLTEMDTGVVISGKANNNPHYKICVKIEFIQDSEINDTTKGDT